jgi:septum formation protein
VARRPAPRLVLASGSPRRRDLLELLGVPFEVESPDVDETPLPGERPADHVRRIATAKAEAVVLRRPGALIIAADTVVDLDDRILGKPSDAADAAAMLRSLSARDHRVHTALVVGDEIALVTTTVRFDELRTADIERYVASGEPLDKAGAYAIQGAGAAFIRELHGSVTNVAGLPLAELRGLLARAGAGLAPRPAG